MDRTLNILPSVVVTCTVSVSLFRAVGHSEVQQWMSRASLEAPEPRRLFYKTQSQIYTGSTDGISYAVPSTFLNGFELTLLVETNRKLNIDIRFDFFTTVCLISPSLLGFLLLCHVGGQFVLIIASIRFLVSHTQWHEGIPAPELNMEIIEQAMAWRP